LNFNNIILGFSIKIVIFKGAFTSGKPVMRANIREIHRFSLKQFFPLNGSLRHSPFVGLKKTNVYFLPSKQRFRRIEFS
jgi:hypothetical protein